MQEWQILSLAEFKIFQFITIFIVFNNIVGLRELHIYKIVNLTQNCVHLYPEIFFDENDIIFHFR